jgi:hypothetical protein
MAKDESGKEKILAAIRRAAAELGRAPSRGELRRITGVSHYRVLAEFRTLRDAVRAAGLEPNPKGEKISTEDLLADWKRVAEKLGRRPSRTEYVREGKYSAGAFVGRFGSWSGIRKNPLTTKDTKEHGGKTRISGESLFHNARRKLLVPRRANYKGCPYDSSFASSESLRTGHGTQRKNKSKTKRTEEPDESVLHDFNRRVPLAAVPSPLVGMRKVTESVAQMVVNTLLGSGYWPLDRSNQPSALSIQPGNIYHGDTEALRAAEENGRELTRRTRIDKGEFTPRGINKEVDLDPSLAVNALPFDAAQGSGLRPPAKQDDRWRRADFHPTTREARVSGAPDFTARGLYNDRPVMGEPFDRSPMTNAPVNELGVMVLFGMVAAGLGLQVESVQGKFPDCIARRQVAPGKWQYLRIEFEYESKNFKLHGHDPKGCDMIVCWRHNWKDCPAEIEVVELCRLVGME